MARIKCPHCTAILDIEEPLPDEIARCWVCNQPLDTTPKRRKKRHRRPSVGAWRYYLGGIRPFGWVLVGLLLIWLANLIVAFAQPGLSWEMLFTGSAFWALGYVWIGVVGFRDHVTYGMLCFFTCLFTYVYIFMNLEETWRPAALMLVGFLFMGAARVVP